MLYFNIVRHKTEMMLIVKLALISYGETSEIFFYNSCCNKSTTLTQAEFVVYYMTTFTSFREDRISIESHLRLSITLCVAQFVSQLFVSH